MSLADAGSRARRGARGADPSRVPRSMAAEGCNQLTAHWLVLTIVCNGGEVGSRDI